MLLWSSSWGGEEGVSWAREPEEVSRRHWRHGWRMLIVYVRFVKDASIYKTFSGTKGLGKDGVLN